MQDKHFEQKNEHDPSVTASDPYASVIRLERNTMLHIQVHTISSRHQILFPIAYCRSIQYILLYFN